VWVRYFAVRSLLAIRMQARAFETLVRMANEDAAMQVRVVAIEALAGCGLAALAALVELSRSTIPDLAQAALVALGTMPGPESKQEILNASHSDDAERRSCAIRAMSRAGSADFVEQLRACALGPDAHLAEEARRALTQRRDRESALALVDGASRPFRRESCVAALATMGDAAVPALAYGLRTCELDARRAIVEALSRIRSAKAIDALELALEDGQPAVRQAALAALAHIRRTHVSATTAGLCEGKN
jgi:HEAT repeat protein